MNSDDTPSNAGTGTYPVRIERDEHDYMYLPGEKHFAAAGPPMAANGWAVYPQDRDERRRPSRIDGTAILWSKFHDTPPSAEEIKRWSIYAATSNTAIILGPPSGNTICLDCDITEEALSFAVREVADNVFGRTLFRRVGTHPKVALFYRMAADELPRYQKHVFVKADGVTASDDMIEVLARGRSITAEGIHHRTGSYFTWLEANPILFGPELAPLITAAQLDEFVRRVEEIRPLYKQYRAYQETEEFFEPVFDRSGTLKVVAPKINVGVLDPSTGLVVDGRTEYVFHLVKDVVKFNAGLALDGAGSSFLAATLYDRICREVDVSRPSAAWGSGERGLKVYIGRQLADRTRALKEGKLNAAQVVDWSSADESDDTLEYFNRRAPGGVEMTAPEPVKAEQRKLVTDRQCTSEHVSSQLDRAINAWADDVKSDGRGIHLVAAPVGSGKTTRTVQKIAALDLIQQIAQQQDDESAKRGPIVFMLPTHNNIDELLLFARLTGLDPTIDDGAMIAGAVALGFEETEAGTQIEKIRRFAVGRELKVMKLEGKLLGGCVKADLVEKLEAVGVSSSTLCRTKIKREGEEKAEERFCDHYDSCPVIAKRRALAAADIVFLPRTYLTLPLPTELKHAAGVVADERIFGEVIGYSMLPVEVLEAGRGAPALTRKEREAGVDEIQLLADREAAVSIAVAALRNREDPAKALYQTSERVSAKTTKTGRDYAHAAKRVTSAAFTRGHSIDPSAPADDLARSVDELTRQPRGVKIREEYGFWKTIIERIDQLAAAELNSAERAPADNTLLQYQIDDAGKECVRVSYAREMNWLDAPWLLLDASADETITESLFPGRDVVSYDISADVNMRVLACVDLEWAKKSLITPRDATPAERLACAQRLADARSYVSMVCGLHANGRVLVSTTLAFRKAIENGWTAPKNADFCHFGAVSGLDFGRKHVAQIVIGRSEIPQKAIDGYTGALGRGDEQPEPLLDPYGIGTDLEGNPLPKPPLVTRTLKCRNGSDATYRVMQHAGRKASAIQNQGREEEVDQALGRLRALHRTDTTTAYLVTRAIPQQYIVDRIVSIDELKKKARRWRAVNRAAGVIEGTVLARIAPDIFSDADECTEWFRGLPRAVRERYHRLTVDGAPCWVAGHVDDPVAHVRHVLTQLGMHRQSDKIELVARCACVVEPAAARPADRIEAYLADHEQERDEFIDSFLRVERRHVEKSGLDLRKNGGAYPPSAGVSPELAGQRRTVDVWQAYATIADEWIRHDVDDSDDHTPIEEIEAWLEQYATAA